MSFPKIPDITPNICIDQCDAANLLLASIAMEEISLSKIMDAEHEKIQYALRCGKHAGWGRQDIEAINQSADDMLKTIIKLQMLLQWKLEDVQKLACTTTVTTTTATTTTTSTTCTRSTTTREPWGCCVIGTAQGRVTNAQDPLYRRQACVHLFVPCGSGKDNRIRYEAGTQRDGVSLTAANFWVKTICPTCPEDDFRIWGTGRLKKYCKTQVVYDGPAAYTLLLRESDGQTEFSMQISACKNCDIAHDSGFVPVNRSLSDLCIGSCQ